MTEDWAKWTGEVIGGVFPLRRVLSTGDHSAVFLTEWKAQNLPDAALKLVQDFPTVEQAQISHWTTVAALPHPHLIRLLKTGRCQLGGRRFLFVVMEYADQALSQILPQRPLTAEEAREMLLPTLDAVAFLHRNNLVHGHLKPSNILVVQDQLKLASDGVLPAGESTANTGASSSVYDPPEAKHANISAAGDIWSLGITLIEALTQHPLSLPAVESETVLLPADLPPMFAGMIRRCLNRNPAGRPTATDLQAEIDPALPLPVATVPESPSDEVQSLEVPTPEVRTPQVPSPEVPTPAVSSAGVPSPLVSIPAPTAREAPHAATPSRVAAPPAQPRRLVPAIAVLLIVLTAIWAAVHVQRNRASSQTAAPSTAESQNSQASSPAPSELPAQPDSAKPVALPPANGPTSVLHQEIPEIPRGVRDTIHGRIRVDVRVTVDSSGNVVEEALEKAGPSKYFSHLAAEAARKWKFAPANGQSNRKWLLRFEFARAGATAQAGAPRS
jgi:TonB family protein